MGRVNTFSTAEVVALYRSGKSLRDVAALVGASSEGVRGRLVSAGEPVRTLATASKNFDWPKEAIADLRRLHAAGDSAAQISREINRVYAADVTRNSVIGKLHRLGIVRSDEARKAAVKAGGNMQTGKAPAFRNGFKRPKLKLVIAGKGAVLVVPEAHASKLPPPREIDISVASEPKPWLERRFGECAWPVDGVGADVRSCCNPTGGQTYCATHQRVMIGTMPKSWAGFSKPGFAKAISR